MFYFYLTIAYYCFLSLLAQLLMIKIGYINVLGSFALNICLTFVFVTLALRKFKIQHECSNFLYMLGACFAVFGMATLFLRENYFNAFTFCLGLMTACLFTSYGLIIMLYNKVGSDLEEHDDSYLETKEESRTNLIYAVIFRIDELLCNPEMSLKREFVLALNNCQVYLSELARIDYPVRKALLEQILDILSVYANLKETLLPTQHCWETIEKIEASFNLIEEALANMYRSYSDKKLDEAQIKSDVLIDYLNLNGYLN